MNFKAIEPTLDIKSLKVIKSGLRKSIYRMKKFRLIARITTGIYQKKLRWDSEYNLRVYQIVTL